MKKNLSTITNNSMTVLSEYYINLLRRLCDFTKYYNSDNKTDDNYYCNLKEKIKFLYLIISDIKNTLKDNRNVRSIYIKNSSSVYEPPKAKKYYRILNDSDNLPNHIYEYVRELDRKK